VWNRFPFESQSNYADIGDFAASTVVHAHESTASMLDLVEEDR
jgi:hypothetical protein